MVNWNEPTPSDVRQVVDGDSTDYPDPEVQAFIDDAVSLISNQIEPAAGAGDATALKVTAKYIAAAYLTGGRGTPGVMTRISQGDASMSWASAQLADETVDFLQRAVLHDPTGNLGRKSVSFSVH